MRNLSQSSKRSRLLIDGANNVLTAGFGDTPTSTVVDMLGFGAILAFLALNAITATGSVTFKAQGSDDNATWADIAGASVTCVDTDDNKLLILDLYRPRHRYLRFVSVRATANCAIDALIIDQYLPDNMPVTQSATVAQAPVVLNAPA